MSVRQIMAVAVLALASLTSAEKGVEVPAQQPELGSDTVAGCFSSLADMTLDNTGKWNTQGACAPKCRTQGFPVGATYAKNCYCGNKMPNKKTLVDDSKCNEPCPGFDQQACGGLGVYTVYNTGVQVNVEEAEYESTSTSTSTSPTSTSSSTADTPTVPAESQSPSDKPSKSNNSNTVGIAVGVVVGVLVISAIAGGAFFFIRRKRNAELEEEHRRNAAVNAFISGGKAPRSSGGMSIADSRMDPVMNRRMSDGSIADNQDYSRRILRVTNA
ncbi:hypothetical protein F4802DRAFT_593618 [Xylaria palmicola]|nr:hypothetical protein F4802DRAFT_593618 [Xylaria palmicola]